MRVLLISNMYPTAAQPSGGIFVARRLSEHRAAGWHISAVALRSRHSAVSLGLRRLAGMPSAPMLPGDGFLDLPVPTSLPRSLIARRRYDPVAVEAAATKLLSLHRPEYDLVHAHGMFSVPAGAVARRVAAAWGVPYAVSLHGSDVHTLMPQRAFSYASILDGAAATCFVSEALRRRAGELGASLANSSVVPNGVDCDVFVPRKSNCASVPGPVVAFVGNLLPVKGADRLPAIFDGIRQAIPEVRFVVAGGGPLRPELERVMKHLPVDFRGRIAPDAVSDVMREADLVVLPSRQEGWPCVVLEAHACGTPVVVSDAGGSVEAVGDPAFVVASGEDFVARFADRVVQELRVGGVSGSLRARALTFSWRAVAEQERAVLSAAVSGG